MRLLTDENFNGAILRGLIRRLPELDIVRVQDVGLMNADDPDILEWAANEGRILLTHDVATITMYAYERVNQGRPMIGVIEVIATAPIGRIINDLELFVLCSQPEDYENQVLFIPFP
jgi:predicted nuclease of predicted toxin-antitoxin system